MVGNVPLFDVNTPATSDGYSGFGGGYNSDLSSYYEGYSSGN